MTFKQGQPELLLHVFNSDSEAAMNNPILKMSFTGRLADTGSIYFGRQRCSPYGAFKGVNKNRLTSRWCENLCQRFDFISLTVNMEPGEDPLIQHYSFTGSLIISIKKLQRCFTVCGGRSSQPQNNLPYEHFKQLMHLFGAVVK